MFAFWPSGGQGLLALISTLKLRVEASSGMPCQRSGYACLPNGAANQVSTTAQSIVVKVGLIHVKHFLKETVKARAPGRQLPLGRCSRRVSSTDSDDQRWPARRGRERVTVALQVRLVTKSAHAEKQRSTPTAANPSFLVQLMLEDMYTRCLRDAIWINLAICSLLGGC